MDLQKHYWKALEEFENKLEKELDGKLEAIIVYGSLAKNQATPDSDLDVLVIRQDIDQFQERISDISYDIDLKYHTFITHLSMTPEEFDYRLKRGEPLIANILRGGTPLYDSGFFQRRTSSIPKPSREVVERFYRNGLKKLEIAQEDLERNLYDMTVHNSFKAGYLIAESLVMSKGEVPQDKKELVKSFDKLAQLNELNQEADQLKVDRENALRAISLAERMVESERVKVYGEK